MIEILNEIANSTTLFIVGAWFGLVITIVLIILFFVKSSRDERGRSIIGKASIISTIVYWIILKLTTLLWAFVFNGFMILSLP